jgi:hypothetical protein
MGQNSLHIATVVEMFTKHVFVASSEVISFKWCRAQCQRRLGAKCAEFWGRRWLTLVYDVEVLGRNRESFWG